MDSPAMGSPLGLIVANIFLFHHEENFLKEFTVEFKLFFYKMVFYRRYVDDSFVLFALSESTHSFGECKVFKLQNIDFNVEHEKHDLLLVLYNTLTVRIIKLSLVFTEKQHLKEFSPIMKVSYQRTKKEYFYKRYYIKISVFVVILKHFIRKSTI